MADPQPRAPREIVITASRVPAQQIRAIAAHIGDPSPPRTGVTVDEYLDLATTSSGPRRTADRNRRRPRSPNARSGIATRQGDFEP